MNQAARVLDAQSCEQARLSRDARFDGLFFTAVLTTRIYCRPVCPAPPPRPENVRYYASASAAEQAGFRPCLRCRPELSPQDRASLGGDGVAVRAWRLIADGALQDDGVAALAQRLGIGERQLRRQFEAHFGISPARLHATARLLFAKQLLSETRMPITDVAMAAGFSSLRRFNAVFLETYRMAPRELRRHEPASTSAAPAECLNLRLGYRPPFDFEAMLAFLRARALPGVEQVDARRYSRVIEVDGRTSWLQVTPIDGQHALRLTLGPLPAAALTGVVRRVRRMFDLDANPQAVGAVLEADPRLGPLWRQSPGLRIPGVWSGFEAAVRAVVGQQVSVAAARTLLSRLVARHGPVLAEPTPVAGLSHAFPDAGFLVDAELAGLGLTSARARTLRHLAQALCSHQVDFAPGQSLEEFVARWCALPGIGPWTAHYLALRGLGHPDAFPAEDLVLQKAAAPESGRLSAAGLRTLSARWQPWRGYAAMLLWRHAATAPQPEPTRRQEVSA